MTRSATMTLRERIRAAMDAFPRSTSAEYALTVYNLLPLVLAELERLEAQLGWPAL